MLFPPRDFDPEQPMLEGLTPIRKFKSYYGLEGAWQKFDNLTTEFKFSNVSQANQNINWLKAPIVIK